MGEISVESAAGQVILNQAFQATQVFVPENPPTPPVTLDLEIDMINNMLIIAKPKNLEDEDYVKKIKAVADALDIDFLEIEDLNVDYLEEDENLYVTGLDIISILLIMSISKSNFTGGVGGFSGTKTCVA